MSFRGKIQYFLHGIAALAAAAMLHAVAPEGSEIYKQHCAQCHESGENRAPPIEAMQQLPASAIIDSLLNGKMTFIGKTLPPGHAAAVAAFLSVRAERTVSDSAGFCQESPSWNDPFSGPRWIGWGSDLDNSRFQPAELAGLSATDVPNLHLKWAFGFPDSDRARAAATVAGGRIYVGGGRDNHIYALEAKSGCIVWKYKTRSEVRSAIVLSPPDPDGLVKTLFGDTRGTIYAIDASSGKHLWRTRIEEHPATTITGSPVYYKGRLFVGVSSGEEFTGAAPDYQCCTFRGSLVALDADNGERLWKTYTIPQQPLPGRRNNHGVIQHGPSGAGIWSAPTIDTRLGRIYITTGDDYSDPATTDSDAIIAFDMDSGKRLWSRQFTPDDAYNMACNPRVDQANCPQARGPDYDFGSSAILVENRDGQRLLVAGQKSGFVHAVDPDQDGVIVWQQRAGAGGTLGGVQYGPAVDSNNIYVAISDISFGRIRDQEGKMRGGAIPDVGGGITAYRLKDGKQIWHTPGYAMSCWAMGLLTSTVSSSNSDSWRCVLRCTRRSYPGLLNREWPVAVEL